MLVDVPFSALKHEQEGLAHLYQQEILRDVLVADDSLSRSHELQLIRLVHHSLVVGDDEGLAALFLGLLVLTYNLLFDLCLQLGGDLDSHLVVKL